MQLFLFCVVLLSLCRDSKESEDWCYEPQVNCSDPHSCAGPMEWNKIIATCKGQNQSPVNIVTKNAKYDSSLGSFSLTNYDKENTVTIENNGHSVQVTLNNSIKISGGGLPTTYKAVQMHFHWGTSSVEEIGSEHTMDGERYPMELHIVHIKEQFVDLSEATKSTDGIAVLGFVYTESGNENANYTRLIDSLPRIASVGNSTTIQGFRVKDFILSTENMATYYRYNGSLTTPSCSESVVWTVFQVPIQLNKVQLQAFPTNIHYKNGQTMTENYRPLQQLNGRTVTTSINSLASSCIVVSFLLLLTSSFISFLHL